MKIIKINDTKNNQAIKNQKDFIIRKTRSNTANKVFRTPNYSKSNKALFLILNQFVLKVIIERLPVNKQVAKTQAAFNAKTVENEKLFNLNGIQWNTTIMLPNTSKCSNLFQSVFKISHKQSSIPR